jgi:DNA-binding MarR family transcriptional regulator
MVEQIMMINPMTPKRAAVLAALQQAGKPMRPLDIAAATGMKCANVSMMLLRMRSDGQTEQIGHGQWRVTTAHGA